ncbi:uncharacterized protein V1510DRAFT_423926 [Dipodascopsis tothii]|uniref:uncharacterized protein n=1 Tax=Dipodascopsis tothii TaxID=44089 RepID=UPI0034CF40B5
MCVPFDPTCHFASPRGPPSTTPSPAHPQRNLCGQRRQPQAARIAASQRPRRPSRPVRAPSRPPMARSAQLSTLVFFTGYLSHKFAVFNRLADFAVFVWRTGVLVRFLQASALLTALLLVIALPVARIALAELRRTERDGVRRGVSARDQLRRRGSF